MVRPIRSVGVSAFLVVLLGVGQAVAADSIACADGFTKVLDQGGSALCRRSSSVASSDLAEALSQMWWGQARCNGEASDRQTGISQNQTGQWTVTMRFFCSGF